MTQPESDETFSQPARLSGATLLAATGIFAAVAAFVVAWEMFFILFLGILFGVFLTKSAGSLSRVLPLSYPARVGAVTTLLLVLAIGSLLIFGVRAGHQLADADKHLLAAQEKLEQAAADYPAVYSVLSSTPLIGRFLGPSESKTDDEADASSQPEDTKSAADAKSSAPSQTETSGLTSGTISKVAGTGLQAVFGLFQTSFGLAVNSLLIFFVGLFLSLAPETYRDGVVVLFPQPRRERTRDVLNIAGETLWHWLIGRGGSMLVTGLGAVALLTLAGVPMGAMLGLATGVLTFVPNIGSLVALILAILFALPMGQGTVAIVFVGYLVLQLVESYVITPLIQQQQVSLPPALLISFQALMGVLFGFLGAAVASPLLAACKTLTMEVYVKDVLGGEDER
ncbi:AI-2E family transporter [Fuerstiella marisgermanici]|uniref:Pheromone autoinducer 2 transporter n=1 Tax=Fuerstiella marisgermanici TaxID=1891926 RepID=A0A1P8WMJ4_9PLAN|nr:AI-2E family transporter [Fuerstiella marisgermanici]APZ95274.1 pheromone autoinducer 2 transporter [Fuerstiella marisgermanici]